MPAPMSPVLGCWATSTRCWPDRVPPCCPGSAFPRIHGALDYAADFLLTAAAQRNRNHLAGHVAFDGLPFEAEELLFDPQTSGGLLAAVPELEAAAVVPLDRLLVETDCPYMAPEPWRGKRCDSSMLTQVLRRLAEVKGVSPEELARITAENARRVYGIAE